MVKVAVEKQSDERGVTRRLESGSITIYLTVNILDCLPTSILIKSERVGSHTRGFLHIVSILVNELLSRGVPWGHIENKLKYHVFDSSKTSPSVVHLVVSEVSEILKCPSTTSLSEP